MSLCNAFRFFAVSTIVMCVAGSPVRELSRKNVATRDIRQDLMQEESLTVELKSDFKKSSDINSLKLSGVKEDTNSIPLDSDIAKKNSSIDDYQTKILDDEKKPLNDTKHVEKTVKIHSGLDSEEVTSPNLNANSNETISNKAKDSKSDNENFVNILESTDTLHNQTIMLNDNATSIMQPTETTTIENILPTDVRLSPAIDLPINHSIEAQEPDTTTSSRETNISETSAEPIDTFSIKSSVTSPTGKKYTVIERKRITTTTEEPNSIATSVNLNDTEMTDVAVPEKSVDKTELMIKSESAQGRVSLEDAITSDIPSLEKLKTDLLSYPKFTTKSDTESSTLHIAAQENTIDTTTSTITMTMESDSPNTVSSKRAGYLDYSFSVKDKLTTDLTNLKLNGTESLQGPFDAETPDAQDESSDDKIDTKAESQSQLTEDAIKEELLREETLNDNEENAKRHKDERQQMQTDGPALVNTDMTNTTQLNEILVQSVISAPEDNLSVKPINSDKVKNAVLYQVNPNYKPLKKIEVQPAKPFVRDPDDNSWRNESLSSLGIVFKPKNSSKPFTQVLKNKTETEWNHLSEKDTKSEVPDLRGRLEQLAQKRKSKKKKIDSFGNVFYTDYEENSSSEEKSSENTPPVENPVGTVAVTDVPSTTEVTIVTPVQTTSLATTIEEEKGVTALTTTSVPTNVTETITNYISKLESTKATTPKPSKMFNIFDYYESNDEDDIADYLNMAKIDLKKYTIPIQTTYTTLTSPPLPILYTHPISHYTSERKGTVQYFPPRTTKRPRTNKKHNTRHKINSLTDSPKHVLPISFQRIPTTPYDGMYYTTGPTFNGNRVRDDPKKVERNPYLTTPPFTTPSEESFGVVEHDGGYGGPNFAMKHFKELMSDEPSEDERDRDRTSDFLGDAGRYARPHASHTTVDDFSKATTPKDAKTTEDYDYETNFRKDVLERFVANFNENTKRFNSEFPLLYNNSIVHGPAYDRDAATSRAYFRRPGGDRDEYGPLYDPGCDNVTVELSPAYELHYYVPEQEEKREVEAKPVTLPLPYRL